MAIDIDQSHYNAGTATVEADGLTVTGQGTAWLGSVRRGDLYGTHRGAGVRIQAVNTNTSLTLAYSVPALDQTAAPYEIQRTPFDVGYLRAIEDIIRLMGQGALPELADVDGTGGDRLIKMTGPKTAEAFEARRLINIAALTSAGVIELAPNGDATVVPKSELVNGIAVNRRVNVLAERAAYDAEPEQFSVYVADVGDGRAATFFRQGAAGGWSDPAYVTGPAITLDITEVDEVPYGAPPDVTLAPRAGGYDLSFVIPRGMIIEPGTTTTLASDQPAAVDFVPIAGGFRLDIAIPRGATGDIDGVTPFWNSRLGSDADAAAARTGLEVTLPNISLPGKQSDAPLGIRRQGNSIEFGHSNSDGFGNTIGAEATSGDPFILFGAEAGTTNNTYRTRGRKGVGLRQIASGDLQIVSVPNASADNQLLTVLGAFTQGGKLLVGGVEVVERGSNANGTYIRLVDGTQFCHFKSPGTLATTVAVSAPIYASVLGTFTFPAAFIAVPNVSATAVLATGSASWITLGAITTTTAGIYLISAFSGSTAVPEYIAVGRWK